LIWKHKAAFGTRLCFRRQHFVKTRLHPHCTYHYWLPSQ